MLAPLIEQLIWAVDFARTDKGLDVPYMRTKEAKELWRPLYEELTQPLPGNYGNAVERRAPIVTRIAMIYAVLDRSHYIDVKHIEAAMAVWRYCDATAAHIFGAPKRDARLAKLTELLDAAEDGMTRTEINRRLGRRTRPRPNWTRSSTPPMRREGTCTGKSKPVGRNAGYY